MIVKKDKITDEYAVGDYYYRINDTTMNRVLEHAKNGMFCISACRGGIPVNKTFAEFTPEEREQYYKNRERTEELVKDLKNIGLAHIKAIGGFIENADTSDEANVTEWSFIVPKGNSQMTNKEFVGHAVELAKKYGQNSVLIAGIPEVANGQMRYLKPSEFVDIDWPIDVKPDFTNTHVYKDLDIENRPYYSAPIGLNRRNFVFDSISKRNISHIIGLHHVFGQRSWQLANSDNEIVIKKN